MERFNWLPASVVPTLFDTMNEWVWVGDDHEITLYANDRFLEMSGYTREEVIGRKSEDFWDIGTNLRVREEHEKQRKKWMASSYEGKMLRKDGTKLHVDILGSPLPEWGTLGIITDRTDYIEKKWSEKLLLSAIRQSLQGIILVKNKKIASWNRGAKYILGYRESEVIQKSLSGILMKEDIKKIYSSRDEDVEVEVLGKRKDGDRISLILTIVWAKDDPETCIILLRDISHIRKSEHMITEKHTYLMQTVKEYGIIKRKLEYIQELERLFYREWVELQKIYDFFVYSIAHIADVGGVGLRILDSTGENLLLVTEYGLGAMKDRVNSRPYAGSITEESYHKMKPVRILSLIDDPRLRTLTMAHTQRFQSATMYAFRSHGKCIGSIMLFMEDTQDPFDDEFLIHYIELFGLLLGGRGG